MPCILVNLTRDSQNLLLVDSGASISILSKRTFEAAKLLNFNYKHIARQVQITTIGNKRLKYSGCAEISFFIDNKRFKQPFFITDELDGNPDYQGLLGSDFLQKFNCILEMSQKKIRIGDKEVEFFDINYNHQKEKQCQVIRLARKIILDPHTSCLVPIKGNYSMENNEKIIINPKTFENRKIAVNRKIYFQEGRPNIKIHNNSNYQVILNKRSVIGSLQKEIEDSVNIIKSQTKEDILQKRINEFNLQDFNLEHLEGENKRELQKLLQENKDVFSKSFETMGQTEKVKTNIKVRHSSPIAQRPLPIPQVLKEKVRQELQKLREAGIIQETDSPYSSPLLVVHKKDKDKIRLVCDFRLLNRITDSDNYPLPKIFDVLNALAGSKYYAKMDLHSAFHQVILQQEQRKYFAFNCEFGAFHFNRLPFGYKNSSNVFQRLMDACLADLQHENIYAYVDDLVLGASSLSELTRKIKIVFERLRKFNLTVSPDKCVFGVKEIEFLGFKIAEDILSPAKANATKIAEFRIPDTRRKLKRFLGLANFYRGLIENYANLAKPLTELTKQTVRFKPNDPLYKESFQKLQNAFFKPPLICQPDFNKQFYLQTDGSKLAISGTLLQKNTETDMLHPIEYFSRALNDCESRYEAMKLELCAIYNSVKHFKPYIYGRKFILLSDHRPLEHFLNKENPPNIVTRWLLYLNEFDIKFNHIKGEENRLADYLSRDPGIMEADVNRQSQSEIVAQLQLNDNLIPCEETTMQLGSKNLRKKQIQEIVELINQQQNKREINVVNKSVNIVYSDFSDSESSEDEGEQNNSDSDSLYSIESENSGSISNTEQNANRQINAINSEFVRDDLSEVNILKEQDLDTELKQIINALSKGEVLNIKNFRNYYLDDKSKLLMYLTDRNRNQARYFQKGKIVVPNKLREKVIKKAHTLHAGQQKSFNMIRKTFFWPGCFRDVENYVRSCDKCAQFKGRIPKRNMGSMEIPSGPTQIISMDILGPVKKSSKGHKFILTITDHFSRFMQMYPLKTITAEESAQKLIQYVSIFGAPRAVITDNGKNFRAHLLKRIRQIFNISPRFTSSFHANSNGKSERVNTQIKNAINTMPGNNNSWEEYLLLHAAMYNGSFHPAIQDSPDILQFGIDKNRFVNINLAQDNQGPSFKSEVENRVQEINEHFERAKFHLEIAQDKQIRQAAEKAKVRNIKLGDRVFIKNPDKYAKQKFFGDYRALRPINEFVWEIREINNPHAKPFNASIDRLYIIPDRFPHLKENAQIQNISNIVETNYISDEDIDLEKPEFKKWTGDAVWSNVPEDDINNIPRGRVVIIPATENVNTETNQATPVMTEINPRENATAVSQDVRFSNENNAQKANIHFNSKIPIPAKKTGETINKPKRYNLRARKSM